MADDSLRLTHTGKQVMLDGDHFADAASPEIAEIICIALNRGMLHPLAPPEDRAKIEAFFA